MPPTQLCNSLNDNDAAAFVRVGVFVCVCVCVDEGLTCALSFEFQNCPISLPSGTNIHTIIHSSMRSSSINSKPKTNKLLARVRVVEFHFVKWQWTVACLVAIYPTPVSQNT